ncbi:MAG: hypothetical protein H6577_16655 [Lewinellaceae bacterium]|nr:hypothetical protein [Saprospiraceae bacterium]MCB9339756.1 hypothetical protein [Lewinellaceae bacterium]
MAKPISTIGRVMGFLSLMAFTFPSGKLLFSDAQYCNNRFDYCLDYPNSLLPDRYLSPQSDTLLLKSVGQIAEVSVMGKLGKTGSTPERVFEKNLQFIISKNGKATVISTLFGEDFYEANFLCGDFTYQQKAAFSETRSALFTIKVPVNRPELMVRLKADLDFIYE